MKSIKTRLLAATVVIAALSCAPEHRGNTFTEPPPPAAPAVLTTLGVSFPFASLLPGATGTATATGVDQFGSPISTGAVVWSTAAPAIATVDGNGLVMGVAIGQTQVIATASGMTAQALVTVGLPPVATVTVAPITATILTGATQQLTATTKDAANNVLTGRTVTWSSSNQTKATVDATGLVTGVAAGTSIITATSETKSGLAQITINVPPPVCNISTALQLAVGEIHTMTAAEKAFLCLGGGASASEYALISFNSTSVAASTMPVQITGLGTAAIQPGSLMSIQPGGRSNVLAPAKKRLAKSFEWSFRERERRDMSFLFGLARTAPRASSENLAPRFLVGVPANPVVGSIVQINANLGGNLCTAPKQLHNAEVVAVLPHTIVLSDQQSPAGGYTNAQMIDFGTAFDTLGYNLDVQNFGVPTDTDLNNRVAIFFTPGVNVIPAPPGAVINGLFASRDLVSLAKCSASNVGEMFYMPVPDPNNTLNSNYTDPTEVARPVLATLVHEFQHLINAGRRIYVTMAPSFEEVWLDEGLSHIAEELLYYKVSGNLARSNIDLTVVQSSQAQLDAANAYQVDNFGRLFTYQQAPETNSPFGQQDLLEMRGAIWQLLRYAADRKGGSEQATWTALVNTTATGQANFNAVFGPIVGMTRDWAVAQFTDDAGLGVAANYTHPSWNYRSLMPALNNGVSPLLTHSLLAAPVNVTLNGGGAAYLRFSVAASAPATIVATSSGQALPSVVDMILVRTQ